MINVAIMGHGVVGSGVAKILKENAGIITEKTGHEFKVTKILDIRDFPLSEYRSIMTKSFEDIANDEAIDIVVETMGGVEPAFGFVIKATVGGKTSEIRYDRVCKQVMHVNKDCFNAYNFAESLFSYKMNTLYKKFPRPENVDWVTIE